MTITEDITDQNEGQRQQFERNLSQTHLLILESLGEGSGAPSMGGDTGGSPLGELILPQ